MRIIILLDLLSKFLFCILVCQNKYISAFNYFRCIPYKFYSTNSLSTLRIPYNKFTLKARNNSPNQIETKVYRTGVVVDCRANANFLVEIDSTKKQLLCSLSGALYSRKVRIWNKSKVNIEIDLLFPEKGRIIERLEEEEDDEIEKDNK